MESKKNTADLEGVTMPSPSLNQGESVKVT